MTTQRSSTSEGRRFAGDDGAALVEFALVLPFLALTFLGIFEYGTAWRNSTIIASSLRTTVRSVAQSKTSPGADLYALQGLMAALETGTGITVQKVIIYNGAASVNTGPKFGRPTEPCRTTTVPSSAPAGCNVYPASRLTPAQLVPSNFGSPTCNAGSFDRRWCPETRQNRLSAPGGPEWVGVYIEVEYDSVTSLLPNKITVTDYTSSRLEPDAGAI